jgi:TolB-like protein/tetratricopeptide (TPR) repeat protein
LEEGPFDEFPSILLLPGVRAWLVSERTGWKSSGPYINTIPDFSECSELFAGLSATPLFVFMRLHKFFQTVCSPPEPRLLCDTVTQQQFFRGVMPTIGPFSRPEELGPERVRQIRDHLNEVISSPAFAGSKRTQDFLQLVVEHALAGRFDNLRERMIGAEMFGRPIDYDTANDAVVRVKATEVRKKLAQFYHEAANPPAVRIELPTGSYVPRFYYESPEATVPVEPAAAPEQEKELQNVQKKTTRGVSRTLVFMLAALALLAVVSYAGFRFWSNQDPVKPAIRSIVILPMENLSGDPNQEYFADGVTDELIADLGQVSALRVISRTSAMTYKDTKKTLPEIARELAADAVVEGSVLREGNKVRVTAQLIDARTDEHIWAQNYVRDLTSVLALQGEVAQTIADEISIHVTPQEQARLARPRVVNQEAQDFYLLGLHSLNSGDPRQARNYMQEAVDKDPNYAPAYAGLANAYGWLGIAGWVPYSEAFPKQKAAAMKAIELDDMLPEGHVELADAVLNLNWDWATCERELKRALELNPSSTSAHATYGLYLARVGRPEEAVEQQNQLLVLDPVSSRSFMNAGFAYYYARHYDKALAQIQKANTFAPNPAETIFPLGAIYAEKGMYQQSIDEFQKLGDTPHALGHAGNAYARMGQIDKAREMILKLQEHVQKDGVGRYEIALIYAALGEKDEAFVWLEKSFEAHDKGLTFLKIDPCLDPLRSDPRFQDLVRRAGFP